MIQFEQAFKIVMDSCFFMESEQIELSNCLGRVLFCDVYSDINMPPFNKAAMDGYACREEDIFNILEVVEIIPAGTTPKKIIEKNQCSKIMTGAPLPQGATAIIIVEDIEELKNGKVKYFKAASEKNTCNHEEKMTGKPNICFIGEDIKKGEKILEKGTLLKPQHIAVLASVGCVNPEVSKMPKVGVIATGSELVEPDIKPEMSQIRNSNGIQMCSQLENLNINPNYYGIAPDIEQKTFEILTQAISENDIVLISGGVSMGDFDFVPKILKKCELTILFDQIAIQPGKPTTFALGKNKICFGLPGNPVSSFLQFELLVKPLIYKMMGATFKQNEFYLPLSSDITRKKADRKAWIPGNFTNKGIEPINYNGSAHINGFALSDGIFEFPIGVFSFKKGDFVNVRQL